MAHVSDWARLLLLATAAAAACSGCRCLQGLLLLATAAAVGMRLLHARCCVSQHCRCLPAARLPRRRARCRSFPQVYIDGEFFGGCDIMIGERSQQLPRTRHASQQACLQCVRSIADGAWLPRARHMACLPRRGLPVGRAAGAAGAHQERVTALIGARAAWVGVCCRSRERRSACMYQQQAWPGRRVWFDPARLLRACLVR